MTRTSLFIGVASLYLSALAQTATKPAAGSENNRGQPANPGQTSDFLGSESCKSCHEDQYASWKKSLHVQMTRPVEEARVLGDFRPGTRLEKYGRAYAMDTRNGRRFVKIAARRPRPERPFDVAQGRPEPVEGRGAGVPNASQTASTRERASLDDEEFEVHYTLGARRFQGYLSRLPQGRIYVLPVFWHVETGQWIDFKEITPLPPEGTEAAHDFRQIWNVNCFNCHATNLAQNFDTSTKAYNTTWTEMGIGCEACHSPGREHTDRMRAWKAGKIERPASAESRGDPWLKIVSPRTAAPRQIFDTCGYCHGNKTNYFPGFSRGGSLRGLRAPVSHQPADPARGSPG